ncbi:MAG: DUF3772 domain-containing protein [Pseudomonadota bacterium]
MSRWIATALALVLALGLAAGAMAQGADSTPDYDRWDDLARQAERALENGTATDAVLEALRAQIAERRSEFLAAESAQESRIDTLRAQIEALGPVPEEGATEPAEIAERRSELNAQLVRLQAPQRAATEAFNRADGLVGELDDELRARQTDALLNLGPSPLNPALWPGAVTHLTDTLGIIWREFERAFRSEVQRAQARANLPATILLFVIALALVTRGRVWMQRITTAVQDRSGAVGRVAAGYVVSMTQVIVPVLGLYVLTRALLSTGVFGPRGTEVVQALTPAGVLFFGSMWLGYRIFPKGTRLASWFRLDDRMRKVGRFYTGAMGAVLAVTVLFGALFLDGETPYDDDAAVVLGFPIMVLLGLVLYRLGRLLIRAVAVAAPAEGDAPPQDSLRDKMTRLIGRALVAVGVFGPVMMAIGYATLAGATMFPAALSLALIGFLITLHRPISDVYALIAGGDADEASEALVPVLISFALGIASSPLFALIWGVRPAELGELWARFVAGVTIGETRISPTDFLTVIVVFLLLYAITRFIQGTLRTTILPKTRIDVGGRNAITAGVGYVGIFLAGLLAITAAGIDLSNLAIFASALAVGVGFGLQTIVSNFVSGIILLIERPISEGDWIEVGGQMGYVRDISVRSTRIETFDRTDVIVPNADLVSGTVTNWTRGNLTGRVIVPVGVAYGTDTRKVEAILREIAEAHPMVALTPAPAVLFQGFGADSLDFEIRAILRDVNWVLSVKSDMNHEIARRFTEEGIEIPFAQRDIWLRNPEALRGDATHPEPPAVPEQHPPSPPVSPELAGGEFGDD